MKLFIIITMILTTLGANGQDLSLVEPTSLIDTPTAGTLLRGSFKTEIRAYTQGGLLGSIDVGITDRLMFGISYGGANLIGEGEIDWNPQPGVNIRYRLFEEDLAIPALVFGYDSQGYGVFVDSTKRYSEKSRGLFVTASKNFVFLGTIGLHGGVNYSFESEDGDKDINLFVGFDKTINPELLFVAEYDFALNDNDSRSLGSGNGYLNVGLKWIFAGKMNIDFILKNLLENKNNHPHLSREIRISYVEIF
ncbi:hypothetical protein ACFLSX_02775 [Calditrichota bacterium]